MTGGFLEPRLEPRFEGQNRPSKSRFSSRANRLNLDFRREPTVHFSLSSKTRPRFLKTENSQSRPSNPRFLSRADRRSAYNKSQTRHEAFSNPDSSPDSKAKTDRQNLDFRREQTVKISIFVESRLTKPVNFSNPSETQPEHPGLNPYIVFSNLTVKILFIVLRRPSKSVMFSDPSQTRPETFSNLSMRGVVSRLSYKTLHVTRLLVHDSVDYRCELAAYLKC